MRLFGVHTPTYLVLSAETSLPPPPPPRAADPTPSELGPVGRVGVQMTRPVYRSVTDRGCNKAPFARACLPRPAITSAHSHAVYLLSPSPPLIHRHTWPDTPDTSDTLDTSDTPDMLDTPDGADTFDTLDTADTPDTSDTLDMLDTPGGADTFDRLTQ